MAGKQFRQNRKGGDVMSQRTNGVGAATHACHQHVRLAAELVEALLPRLTPDDGLELPNLQCSQD